MKINILAFVWLIFAAFCQGQEAHNLLNGETVNRMTDRSPVNRRIKMLTLTTEPREQCFNDCYKIKTRGTLFKGRPIEWSIGLTNQLSVPVHLIVSTSARGRLYHGIDVALLYFNMTTNLLAPGESKVLTYKVDDWIPEGGGVGDHVRFSADICNQETGKHSSGWIDGYYITSTNDFRIRNNPALIQEFLRAAGTGADFP